MDCINFQLRTSKLRVTRYPYGSRDKVEACPNTNKAALYYVYKFSALGGQTACRVTPGDSRYGPHPTISPTIWPLRWKSNHLLDRRGNWETSIVTAASLANWQSPVIRTQLKKPRARRLGSALILCQVWWRRGIGRLCSRASRVEMGRQQQPTCNHSW